jgi:hypothetical protein
MNSWGILYICLMCVVYIPETTTSITNTTTTADDYNSTTPLPSVVPTTTSNSNSITTTADDYNSTTPLPSEVPTTTSNSNSITTTADDYNSTTPLPSVVPTTTSNSNSITTTADDYNSTTPLPSGVITTPPEVSIDEVTEDMGYGGIGIKSIAIALAVSMIPLTACIYVAQNIYHSTVYMRFQLNDVNDIEHGAVIPVETAPDAEPSLPGLQADFLDEGYETPRVLRFVAVELDTLQRS